jgi:hypothetical protein
VIEYLRTTGGGVEDRGSRITRRFCAGFAVGARTGRKPSSARA